MPYLLLAKVAAGLLLAALLAYGWHVFVERYREQGREEVRVEWDAEKARQLAAVAGQESRWTETAQALWKATQERDDERRKRQSDARQRVKSLPPAVAAAPVPAAAVGMLNDAIDDSAATTRPAGKSDRADTAAAASADSTVGLLTEWGTTVVGMYETCRARVSEWQQFYAGLRASQPEIAQ